MFTLRPNHRFIMPSDAALMTRWRQQGCVDALITVAILAEIARRRSAGIVDDMSGSVHAASTCCGPSRW